MKRGWSLFKKSRIQGMKRGWNKPEKSTVKEMKRVCNKLEKSTKAWKGAGAYSGTPESKARNGVQKSSEKPVSKLVFYAQSTGAVISGRSRKPEPKAWERVSKSSIWSSSKIITKGWRRVWKTKHKKQTKTGILKYRRLNRHCAWYRRDWAPSKLETGHVHPDNLFAAMTKNWARHSRRIA